MTASNFKEKDFLTLQEFALYVNLSLKWVQAHVYSGRLPGVVRFGRAVRIQRSVIDKKMISGQILLDGEKKLKLYSKSLPTTLVSEGSKKWV